MAGVAAAGSFLPTGTATAAPLDGTEEKIQEAGMNIVVLTGSPRKNGNSNTLADYFIRGAEESGHHTMRFDAAMRNVLPCTGCNSCGMNGPFILQDDFAALREPLAAADLVAFVTPMYYFGISAQLKTVIDRFYALNGVLHAPKKAVLMMTYANNSRRNESPLLTHYEVLLEYLGWTDAGRIIAPGVWTAGSIAHTPYPDRAYRLGRGLRKDGEPVS